VPECSGTLSSSKYSLCSVMLSSYQK
jgi:hypothetical protein